MANIKHMYYGTPTYKSWACMKYRCNKNGEKYWHDRGIKICDKWNDFEYFLKDMGKRPENTSLDRIDNNKNYCKENCRWASSKQQNRNRRNNTLFKDKTLSEWSELLGIKRSTLAQRIYVYKWTIEKTLSTNLNLK